MLDSMVTVIGGTFPTSWLYGVQEKHIVDSTARQIDRYFPDANNLLINTTWFGSQFDNKRWQSALELEHNYKNLFLLCVIDPIYLFDHDRQHIVDLYNIQNVYEIGMFQNSQFEWNFHALVGNELMPRYSQSDVQMQSADYVYMLYQRKPRLHRIEITNILREQPHLLEQGIVTLGSTGDQNWHNGLEFEPLLLEDDVQTEANHSGDFGVPNDLTTLGRLDLWQQHFLNVVSETEFDEWQPVFVTEKTWKPMIGMRPFHIHGNPATYQWLRDRGFKTFNHYWDHIPVETVTNEYGQHNALMDVINWLCDKPKHELEQMYDDMLPDLCYNKERFKEFSDEQRNKMENIF
jgi:hypothetical protein